MATQKIMIIRHAEKPDHHGACGIDEAGNQDAKSLTVRGWQRAGALVPFFGPGTNGSPPRPMARPKHLFAASADPASNDSKRPLQTIQPLSAYLSIPIDDSCRKDEVDKLAGRVAAADGVVLISWEHRMIAPIGRLLVQDTQPIPDWPADRFDVVWVFDRTDSAWRLTQVPQRLLHGDRPDMIA